MFVAWIGGDRGCRGDVRDFLLFFVGSSGLGERSCSGDGDWVGEKVLDVGSALFLLRCGYRTRGAKGRSVFFGCGSRTWAGFAIFGLLRPGVWPSRDGFRSKGGRRLNHHVDPPLIVEI